ncbi:amidohydrolase [Halorussus amylolyticus]|uniref:amidohydrolase n=1 Tax=Halorussus amylolyticus TaxID=1126242 RepID=UPI00138F1E08|nr:amidohydrolase [Halorussus amylolyticus]
MADLREQTLTEIRRDLHARPEAGWKEFRTTALLAEELDELGYDVHLGADAVAEDARLGVPDDDEIEAAIARARDEGAPEKYLDRMGDISGLVAEREFGDGSGPTVGIRVDIDALARSEATDDDHRPAREGFGSAHPDEMHACAHDGHAAIGIGIAREFAENGDFDGTLKIFFQPAEEGGRGGKPMSETDHLVGVDYLLALHLGLGLDTGTVVASYERPLANAKLDTTFEGEPAHAGGRPNEGRNALQAAATAIQNLYAIPRHEKGTTRINVGRVHSPNAQNVISEEATMRVEVRGRTAELNEYMLEKAERILEHAAGMHDVDVTTSLYGKTTTFVADDDVVESVMDAAPNVAGVEDVRERKDFGGSEDASYLIRRVQEEGGKATYIGIGASNVAGHHTAYFDIDEDSLDIGVEVVAETVRSFD